jgi:hypothetical protein
VPGVGDHGDRLGLDDPRVHVEHGTPGVIASAVSLSPSTTRRHNSSPASTSPRASSTSARTRGRSRTPMSSSGGACTLREMAPSDPITLVQTQRIMSQRTVPPWRDRPWAARGVPARAGLRCAPVSFLQPP